MSSRGWSLAGEPLLVGLGEGEGLLLLEEEGGVAGGGDLGVSIVRMVVALTL